MNKAEIMRKAEMGEDMTVAEIKVYQSMVKLEKPMYGKYGTLKKKYLEDIGIDWTIADLPTYLHNVDRQAERLGDVMRAKLEKSERFKRTGNFMEDYRRLDEMHRLIEEEILNEIVYVM